MPRERIQEIRAQIARAKIQPTDTRLLVEAREAARILTEVWDGDVEVTVVMTRRNEIARPQWATTVAERDRLLATLDAVKDASVIMKQLVR